MKIRGNDLLTYLLTYFSRTSEVLSCGYFPPTKHIVHPNYIHDTTGAVVNVVGFIEKQDHPLSEVRSLAIKKARVPRSGHTIGNKTSLALSVAIAKFQGPTINRQVKKAEDGQGLTTVLADA